MHLINLNEFLMKAAPKPDNPRDEVKANIKKEIFKALNGCSYNFSKEILEEVINEIGYKAHIK